MSPLSALLITGSLLLAFIAGIGATLFVQWLLLEADLEEEPPLFIGGAAE